ncbi:MAG: hypothetical protein II145_10265 [Selenomonas sp.]|jgi:hypothetical protein|nr:hypothetical protein [Oscillospiraceae bacterium]MBQ1877066.1 hypothetical protein [Selenomonas sp.]MCI7331654.1 hypothetical protein [Selenomonadaceae bacterium]MDD6119794.1 hypothetical protein [Selenomonadaceae bacterium]MDD7055689.1 hypothetical protein [Selenomonadaceae bacterium]
MVTEILGLLIIVGAGIVFLVRWQMHRTQRPKLEQREMQVSTARLKEELQRSGDAIVNRMSTHVSQLEKLIKDADERAAQLDSRIAACRRLEAELELRSAELSQRAQQTVASARIAASAARQPLSQPTMQSQTAAPAPDMLGHAVSMAERVDAEDFAQVLHDSMQREEAQVELPTAAEVMADAATPPAEQTAPTTQAAMQQVTDVAEAVSEPLPMAEATAAEPEADGQEEPGTSAATRARALLLAGYSIEDTMRETGLGQGAVQLIQEMNRHAMAEADKA